MDRRYPSAVRDAAPLVSKALQHPSQCRVHKISIHAYWQQNTVLVFVFDPVITVDRFFVKIDGVHGHANQCWFKY